jgi:creatinine amidohydrolase
MPPIQFTHMRRILFEELHPDELRKIVKESGIVFLPLGTLEWHEEHLPFGTDCMHAHSIATAVCEKTGGCVLPPLYLGTDKEHEVDGKILHGKDAVAGKILPGSVYFLRQDLFYQVLKSIAKNLAYQGFRKLVIVSGHAGTAHVAAIERLREEGISGLDIITTHGKNWAGGLDHAGEKETALMMKIDRDLVHMEKLPKPYKGILRSDPHRASEEKGKRHFREIVNQIVKEVSVS